jgi:flagellar biogenesis protein FliO
MDFYKALSKSGKKPNSILKIVLGFSVALLVMWLFMVSRMDTGSVVSQSNEPEVQERTLGLQQSLRSTPAEEMETENQSPENNGEVAKKESPALFQNAFVTFMVMVVMLGGVWLWLKKRGDGNPVNQKKNRELDTHALGENSQLKFLEINEEIWIIGMSENGINLLHRYPKSEWKEGLQDELPEAGNSSKFSTKKGDFKSFLKLVSG